MLCVQGPANARLKYLVHTLGVENFKKLVESMGTVAQSDGGAENHQDRDAGGASVVPAENHQDHDAGSASVVPEPDDLTEDDEEHLDEEGSESDTPEVEYSDNTSFEDSASCSGHSECELQVCGDCGEESAEGRVDDSDGCWYCNTCWAEFGAPEGLEATLQESTEEAVQLEPEVTTRCTSCGMMTASGEGRVDESSGFWCCDACFSTVGTEAYGKAGNAQHQSGSEQAQSELHPSLNPVGHPCTLCKTMEVGGHWKDGRHYCDWCWAEEGGSLATDGETEAWHKRASFAGLGSGLPIEVFQEKITQAIRSNTVTSIQGETGMFLFFCSCPAFLNRRQYLCFSFFVCISRPLLTPTPKRRLWQELYGSAIYSRGLPFRWRASEDFSDTGRQLFQPDARVLFVAM